MDLPVHAIRGGGGVIADAVVAVVDDELLAYWIPCHVRVGIPGIAGRAVKGVDEGA